MTGRRETRKQAAEIRRKAGVPDDNQEHAPEETGKPGETAPRRRLILTPASEIEPEPVVWAWEDNGHGRIPAGSLGLTAGREGTGKSSFAIWQAARVTIGTLPGAFHGRPRAVIYVAVEDSWKHTIVPRLMAAGADLTRVYRAEVRTIEDEAVSLSLPADNKLLEDGITKYDVALVVLDPLMSAISDTLDTHVNRQVRRALDPLAGIADRTGALIMGIAHFSKSGGTDASSLITGSGAFKDVARFIFAFATDEDDDTIGVITQTKNSLGRSRLPSLAYRMIEAIVPTTKGDAKVGRFVLDGESERSVQDILGGQGTAEEQDEKVNAENFLREALASGPRRSRDVEEEAKELHGISQRTLKRARRDLHIKAAQKATGPRKRVRDGKEWADGPPANEWWICLPEYQGDLEDLGQGANRDARAPEPNTPTRAECQRASDGPRDTAWPPGTLPPVGETPQSANGQSQGAWP